MQHNTITSVQAQSTENYKLISLTNGMSAKVSPEDYERLNKHSWYFQNTNRYAATNETVAGERYVSPKGESKPQQRTVLMHRVVMNVDGKKPRMIVDHINGDRLDNRRENLRIVSGSQNLWNRNNKLNRRNTSGHRGISITKHGTYVAMLNVNRKHYRLGTFKTLEEAVAAYNAKKQQLLSL